MGFQKFDGTHLTIPQGEHIPGQCLVALASMYGKCISDLMCLILPTDSSHVLCPLPRSLPTSSFLLPTTIHKPYLLSLSFHYALRSHATSRPQLFRDGPVSCFFLQNALLPCSPLPLLPGIHVCLASPGWNSLHWCCVRVSVGSMFTPHLVPFTEGAFRSLSMALLLWVYLLHLSLRHIPHLSGPQFLYPLFSLLFHIGLELTFSP